MKIAVVTWNRRRVGGTETYLNSVVPELHRDGTRVAFWCEFDDSGAPDRIGLPADVPAWSAEESGRPAALAALRDWGPDLIFSHGLSAPELEREIQGIAPAVLFAHNYYGTCISGSKTLFNPRPTPCARKFGPECLFHYYPRRCGGWNPLTMWGDYQRQTRRLKLMSRYARIVTSTEHMQAEFARHGLAAECVGLPVSAGRPPGRPPEGPASLPGPPPARRTRRLLFLGRMDSPKGGHVLLEALPRIGRALDRALDVTFAGDGPRREEWRRLGARVEAANPGIRTEFPGWIPEGAEALLDETDLLVVPSIWPEPFGLVGPEAGLRGVPAAAFDVGGIRDWLRDGINGHLAPGNPPTAEGLAAAVVKCLADPGVHGRLRQGAREIAEGFTMQRHLDQLSAVFRKVLS